jgi:CspA family cold shock protein
MLEGRPPSGAALRVVDPLLERTVRLLFTFGKTRRVDVATGTIKKVIADRGFGFITADDEKDYFFHRGALDSSLDFDRLVGGERVDFDIEQSPKGPRASRVKAA